MHLNRKSNIYHLTNVHCVAMKFEDNGGLTDFDESSVDNLTHTSPPLLTHLAIDPQVPNTASEVSVGEGVGELRGQGVCQASHLQGTTWVEDLGSFTQGLPHPAVAGLW